MATYIIEFGDTLARIARRFNTTVEELRVRNNIQNINVIIAGHPLEVPPFNGIVPPSLIVPVVRRAKVAPASYWTGAGTHAGPHGEWWPAADIFAPIGAEIFMPEAGVVRDATNSVGGFAAIIETDSGHSFYMAHASIAFHTGRFAQGAVIGAVGDSGNAAGNPHVHMARSSSGPQLFDDRGGSGDYQGDSSWWVVG